jgi:polyhydroxyalkanoate synthesis regulator phasin
MAQKDAWRAYYELALGLTETSRKQAAKIAARVAGKGGATAEQLQQLAEDLITAGLANREAMTRMVKVEIDRALGRVGLATMDEVDELTKRVRELELELRESDGGDPASTHAHHVLAADPLAPVDKATAKKTVAKKTIAKKAGVSAPAPAVQPVVAASAPVTASVAPASAPAKTTKKTAASKKAAPAKATTKTAATGATPAQKSAPAKTVAVKKSLPAKTSAATKSAPTKSAATKSAAKAPKKTTAPKKTAPKKTAPKKTAPKKTAAAESKGVAGVETYNVSGQQVRIQHPAGVTQKRIQGILDRLPPGKSRLSTVIKQLAKHGAAFVPWDDGKPGDSGAYETAAKKAPAKETRQPPASGSRPSKRGKSSDAAPPTSRSTGLVDDAKFLEDLHAELKKAGAENLFETAKAIWHAGGRQKALEHMAGTKGRSLVKAFLDWMDKHEQDAQAMLAARAS